MSGYMEDQITIIVELKNPGIIVYNGKVIGSLCDDASSWKYDTIKKIAKDKLLNKEIEEILSELDDAAERAEDLEAKEKAIKELKIALVTLSEG